MAIMRITAALLNERFNGPSERFYRARLPELVRVGLAAKQGKAFFGDPDEIALWLAGRTVKASPPRVLKLPARRPAAAADGGDDGAA